MKKLLFSTVFALSLLSLAGCYEGADTTVKTTESKCGDGKAVEATAKCGDAKQTAESKCGTGKCGDGK